MECMFVISLSIKIQEFKHVGKFLGVVEEGTRTSRGTLTGLDYLVDLGVTHIQLLPTYDFGSVDELKPI